MSNVGAGYKKDERKKIKNYRLVSVLSSFSNIYEKFIQESITPFAEQWKSAFDNKHLVRTVPMDFTKAFDCIPHYWLISKLHAYGFGKDRPTFFCSYLKGRKKN